VKTKHLKIGAKLKITGNTTSHGFRVGEVVTITQINYDTSQYCCRNEQNLQYWVNPCDYDLVNYTKEEIEKEIAEQELEIAELKDKIAFLAATGKETYDENEFAVWSALTTIENENLSKIEKATLIARLIK
jgi:hypothetical protein